MIAWTQASTRAEYENQRYSFLLATEEQGEVALDPYNDNRNAGVHGNISIGVGFNLEGPAAVRNAVFRAFGLIRDNPALSNMPGGPGQSSPRQIENNYIERLIAQLRVSNQDFTALNAIMAERAGDSRLAALGSRRATFAFTNEAEVRVVFDELMTTVYEPLVNSWLGGIPDSRERVALVSLAWNNVVKPGDSQNLRQAIQNGDRAEAWYEIRYSSNSASQAANIRDGIAKRRYYEADTFGLFDEETPDNDLDAKGAFRTYTRHRVQIDAYDAQFGAQVAAAISDYNTSIVRTREDWFAPAREYLRETYFTPVTDATLNGSILVGENDGSDGGPDTRWYRNDRVNDDVDFDLRGSSNNDLIFAESGNDQVRGGAGRDVVYGGSGHDILTAGAGNDYLEGGFGDDTYYLGTGDGQDEIKDSAGSNTIVFDGTPVRLFIRNVGETSYHTTDGRFTAAMQGDSLLVTDSQPGASTLIRSFVEGDFGIRFHELGPIPPVGSYAPITDINNSPQLNTYTGTAAAETTTGSDINDDIFGLGGGDYLLSGAGDDRIEAGGDTLPAVIDAGVGRDVIVGSNGNDRLIGGPVAGDADDAIQGAAGDDYIEGGGGNDLLAGGAGRDILVGGEGNDSIRGAASMVAIDRAWAVDRWPDPVGPIQHPHFEGDIFDSDGLGDVAYGGNGLDLIVGGGGDDVFFGENGNDSLTGNGGNDFLSGGNDVDTLDGGYGNDRLFGGEGNDFLFGEGFASAPGEAGDDYLDGGAGADTAHGSDGNDTVLGDIGEDYLYGEAGADMLLGGADADHLFGGGGSDLLYGDDGDDWLQGGDGTGSGDADDVLIGGTGVDTLLGEEGDDVLTGGEGNDQLVGGAGADILDGGTGNDTLFSDIFDTVVVRRGEGSDVLAISDGQVGGRLQLEGFDVGTLTISQSVDASGIQYLMITDAGGTDSLSIQRGFLQAPRTYNVGGDELTHQQLMLLAPSVSLFGSTGNDVMYGSNNADTIRGYQTSSGAADGNDMLIGQGGDDRLEGGKGDDTFRFSSGDGHDTIVDSQGANTLAFTADVEADTLYLDYSGGTQLLTVRYAVGDQIALGVVPATQAMTFAFADGGTFAYQRQLGSTASDSLVGSAAFDILSAGQGDDALFGGAGSDALVGGDGRDWLNGGTGADVLVGGADDDTYLFNLGDGHDIVRESGADGSNSAEFDVIQFGAGVNWSDLSFSASSNDLVIAVAGGQDSILIEDWFGPNSIYRIDRVLFADATAASIAMLPSMATANVGTDGNDTLHGDRAGSITLEGLDGDDTLTGDWANETLDGGFGNDVLAGSRGTDTLIGGFGNDIYRFARLDGHDAIVNDDGDADAIDAIELASNIAPADVKFARLQNDLLLWIAGTQDRLTVRDYFGTGAVDEIRFANGTIYTPLNVPAVISNLVATTGADLLVGTPGADSIDGLAGNDEIHGGEGNDTITDGSGLNTIFGDDGTDSITAEGTIDGGAGDDVLTATGSAIVTLSGNTGNDVLDVGVNTASVMDGGAGDDTYVIRATFNASHRINQDDAESGSVDTVRFAAGIAPGAVSFTYAGEGDLLVSYGTLPRLTISGFLLEQNSASRVDQFVFDDAPGVIWTAAFVESLVATPSAGGNYIRGTSGADSINALGGDDVIHGGAGDDTLTGGGVGSLRLDVLHGDEGNDTLLGGTRSYGGSGNDHITGTDEMYGGAGDDVLDGLQAPADHVNGYEGGSGSDTYIVHRSGSSQLQRDTIGDIDRDGQYLDFLPNSIEVLQFATGIAAGDVHMRREEDHLMVEVHNRWDVVERTITVEHFFAVGYEDALLDQVRFTDDPATAWTRADILGLVHEGSGSADELIGSSGADVLHGNAGDDLLRGEGGNDALYGGSGDDDLQDASGNNHFSGGAGNDLLQGGLGDDTYHFGHGQGHDEISDYQIAASGNTVEFDAGIVPADVTFYRTSGVGLLSGPLGDDLVIALNGSSEQMRVCNFFGQTNFYRFSFANGAVLTGQDITSLGLVVNLGGAASSQPGTAADNTFVVDHPGDVVVESAGGGIDTVEASISYSLGSWIENLTLTGIFNNDASGNELDNVIRGNVADNVLSGSANYLSGGQDADTLIGGQGDDTYLVNNFGGSDYAGYLNTNDTIIELEGEGYDTVNFTGYSLILPDNVERAIVVATRGGFQPNTVPGGADSRPRITGNALDNVIDASGASDASSSLVIDGGEGADEMIGGVDGQTFVIDNAGDVIRFRARGNPIGNVEAYISYTAPDYIRNITLLGSQTISASGNDLNNTLDGSQNTAANVLSGGLGDDVYIVGAGDTIVEAAGAGIDTMKSVDSFTLQGEVENLLLLGSAAVNGTGNALNNQLTGNSAANTLDGGAGADAMAGAGGNDIYIVDNGGDTISEGSNAGADEVRSSISYTLGSNVENLTLTGTAAINGTGNSAVNILQGNAGDNTLDGGTGNDTMRGDLGNDIFFVNATGDSVVEFAGEGIDEVRSSATISTLAAEVENLTLTGTSGIGGTGNGLDNVITGNSGNNSLSGGNGNDTLIGGAGSDPMSGGAGNDTFYVDATGDGTSESSGQGIDTVISSVTRTLSSNIELLFLSGTSAINGTGNGLSNLLRGNAANNTLTGAAGIDILEGGAGNDTLSNTTNKSLLNGGADTDTLTGTAVNDLLIGGTGNDALTTGAGADIIVFNRGDGQDTVAASTTRDNTVSIGGAVYADLLFQKNGNDLVLQVGATDRITFVGYYTSSSNRSVNNLQVVIEGTSEYDSGSADALRNNKIETFNFEGLVAAFDAARTANPTLTTWALTNALLTQHLSGSDTAAIGGDLAYRYNRFGTLSDISFTPALGILGASGFGTTAQALQGLASLQDSSARLS